MYTVAGRGLDPRQVERAVKLSKEKYCSATIMLAKTAEITYEIVQIDGDSIPDPADHGYMVWRPSQPAAALVRRGMQAPLWR